MDWLGCINNDEDINPYSYPTDHSNCELLAELHCLVSSAFECRCDSMAIIYLREAVGMVFNFSENNNINMHQIILEKVEYNKHRADHKRENRAKAGGKKY